MNNILSLIIVCTIFLSSCTNYGETHDRMALAERQLASAPDSALNTVKSIDRHSVNTPADNARYALLYSMALDLNSVYVTEDSLTRIAVNFYNKYGSAEKRMLANFYHGLVLRNSGEYIRAMLAFLDAESDISSADDARTAGLIYSRIGDIYKIYCDYSKSLEAYGEAYRFYTEAGLTGFKSRALLDMGTICRNMNKNETGIEYVQSALSESETDADSAMIRQCLCELTTLYDSANRTTEARATAQRLLSEFNGCPCNTDVIGSVAHIYAIDGKFNKAVQYLERGWMVASDIADSATMYLHSARVLKRMKLYERAYSDYSKFATLQSEMLQEYLRRPIISEQRDYFRTKSEYNHRRYLTGKITIIAIIVAIIILAVAITKYIQHKIYLKNEEINRYLVMVQELKNGIRQSDNDMSSLLDRLLKDRLQLIDELGDTYYEQPNTGKQQEQIYNKVKSVINDLSDNKKTLCELEDIVNRCKNNTMARLRIEFPELKEKDLKLACYLFAGFSNRVICVFTGDNIENVYKRKSRLKARISVSNAKSKKLILDAMS